MVERGPKLAVLIDADNTSFKVADALFDEVAKIGEASLRRIYGDFSDSRLRSWADILARHAILPYQQFAYTSGKNSSDIVLVIDAMDLLHSGRFDGFVLVSSDSDFTRLAARIREQGLDVFGIGAQKTPEAFRKACKRFIFLENLENPEAAVDSGGKPAARAVPVAASTLTEARDLILKAMDSIDQEDDWYALGPLGQFITAANPDFDTRSYGKKKLSDLVADLKIFETKRGSGNQLLVRRID